MFNPTKTKAPDHSNAIVRIDPCGVGTSVVFTDRDAMDSYVAHVQGVAERRFPLQNGGYLQGESIEQKRDKFGGLVFGFDDDEGEYPVMVTYPWLRLR